MAWSWSHTDEAYAAAESNLRAMPVETLREIWAEWLATDTDYPHAARMGASFQADLLGWALGRVNWDELADAWIETVSEQVEA